MLKFCYERQVSTLPYLGVGLSAISPKGKQWGVGDTINVTFIHGSKAERDAVKKHAQDWFNHANLKVNWYAALNDSDVRISFMKGRGSWSYVGTDCLNPSIPKHEPTMNFGWDITNDKGTILHEWGHALAYSHSHFHFDKDFEFDKEKIYKDLAGPPNYWSKEKVDYNIFRTINSHDYYHTDFDRESVMLYPFEGSWLKSGKPTKSNDKLSTKDIEMVKRLYPNTK